jgi:hypothetical protein
VAGLLRGIAKVILAGLALLVGVAVVARFHDGPISIFPGGPFRSGERVVAEPDWAFARDIPEVELQLVDPPRSRIVWLVVHDGLPYVACGFLDVPLWKQWPYEVLEDDRVVLRIDGRLYERKAVKVTDPAEYAAVATLAAEKYGQVAEPPASPDAVWFFRLEPRRDAS